MWVGARLRCPGAPVTWILGSLLRSVISSFESCRRFGHEINAAVDVRSPKPAAGSTARAVYANRWVETNPERVGRNSPHLPGPTIALEVDRRRPALQHSHSCFMLPCRRTCEIQNPRIAAETQCKHMILKIITFGLLVFAPAANALPSDVLLAIRDGEWQLMIRESMFPLGQGGDGLDVCFLHKGGVLLATYNRAYLLESVLSSTLHRFEKEKKNGVKVVSVRGEVGDYFAVTVYPNRIIVSAPYAGEADSYSVECSLKSGLELANRIRDHRGKKDLNLSLRDKELLEKAPNFKVKVEDS